MDQSLCSFQGVGSVVVDSLFDVHEVMGVLCLIFVLLSISLCPFKLCNHLDEEERAD